MIVANTTYQAAPWADALFAMDRGWWQVWGDDVAEQFAGLRFSTNLIDRRYGVQRLSAPFDGYGNSGAACVALALESGARRVILLGFDCQATGGKKHWHGDHPPQLGNANAMPKWMAKFDKLARDKSGHEIINCSRETALTCWPRMPLAEALALS